MATRVKLIAHGECLSAAQCLQQARQVNASAMPTFVYRAWEPDEYAYALVIGATAATAMPKLRTFRDLYGFPPPEFSTSRRGGPAATLPDDVPGNQTNT